MWYGYIFIYGYLILQSVQVRLILIDLCTYMLYITLHYPATPMSLGTNKALVLDINICPGQVNSVFGQVACLMQLSHPFSTRKNSHRCCHTSSPACPWCRQIRGCVQQVRELSTNQCFCCEKIKADIKVWCTFSTHLWIHMKPPGWHLKSCEIPPDGWK